MDGFRKNLGVMLLAAGSIVASALGQSTQPASVLPADQMLRDLQNPTQSSSVVEQPATQPGMQAIRPEGSGDAVSKILREGSEVIDRSGRIHKSSDSMYQEFVFDKSVGAGLEPMYVLPNRELMSMEYAVSAAKRDVPFKVSGT